MSESAERQPASNPSSFRKTTAMRTHADHGQFGTPWYASPEVTARVHQPAKPAQVQAKLKVGSAFDPAEAEADNAAREVVSKSNGAGAGLGVGKGVVQTKPLVSRISRQVQRVEEDKADAKLQRQEKEESTQMKVMRAEDEEASPKLMRAEEDEASPKLMRAEEEEASPKLMRAEEEEASPKLMRAEEEEASPKLMRAEEEKARDTQLSNSLAHPKLMRAEEEKARDTQLSNSLVHPKLMRAEDEEASPKLQRQEEEARAKCADCEEKASREEEEEAMTKQLPTAQAPSPSPQTPDAAPINHLEGFTASENTHDLLKSRKGAGEPLPEPLKNEMEAGFGADFSNVKVHRDSASTTLNKDLKAKAFTHGEDVFFGQGQFDAGSNQGKELIAHELTHTIQQGAVGEKKAENKPAESPVEEMASTLTSGDAVSKPESKQVDPSGKQSGQVQPVDKELPVTELDPAELEQQSAQSEGADAAAVVDQAGEGDAEGEGVAGVAEGEIPDVETESEIDMPSVEKQRIAGQISDFKGSRGEVEAKGGEVFKFMATETENVCGDAAEATAELAANESEHPTPVDEVAAVEAAEEVPDEFGQQMGNAAQVEGLEKEGQDQEDAKSDPAKKAMLDQLDEDTPTNLGELKDYNPQNTAGEVTSVVGGEVGKVKQTFGKIEQDAKPMDTPDAVELKPVPSAKDTAKLALGQDAVPAIPEEMSNMDSYQDDMDAVMAEEGITEEQMAMVDSGPLAEAQQGRAELREKVANAPTEMQEGARKQAKTVESEMDKEEDTARTEMKNKRKDNLENVHGEKQKTKTKLEEEREKVTKQIQSMYQTTEDNVKTRLNNLEKENEERFAKAVVKFTEEFKTEVDTKVNAFLDERHSGWFGWARAAKDWLLGVDEMPEVKEAFETAKKNYIDKIDTEIKSIIQYNNKVIQECKADLKKGKDEIDKFVKTLKPNLQDAGKKAAVEMSKKFDELDTFINEKQKALVDKLCAMKDKAIEHIDKVAEKMKEALSGALSQLIGLIVAALLKFFNWALGLFGYGMENLEETIVRTKRTLTFMVKHPIDFMAGLFQAVGMGFTQFGDNIQKHLVSGLVMWLTGGMREEPIRLPDKWDLKGILFFIMEVLGLGWANLRKKLVKHVGEHAMGLAEKGLDIVMKLFTEGPIAMWEDIRNQGEELKGEIFAAVREMMIIEIIKQGVIFLLSLTNPASGIVKAIKAIYDFVMWFFNNIHRIIEMVKKVFEASANIVEGNLGGAANAIERIMGLTIPVIIDLFLSILGLSGLPKKVMGVIKRVGGKLNALIDKLLLKVVGVIKKMFGKGKKGGGAGMGDPEKDVGGLTAKDHQLHKKYVNEIEQKLSAAPEKETSDFEGFYESKKNLAKKLESTYNGKLTKKVKGKKLKATIKVEAKSAASRDDEINFSIKIAPNDALGETKAKFNVKKPKITVADPIKTKHKGALKFQGGFAVTAMDDSKKSATIRGALNGKETSLKRAYSTYGQNKMWVKYNPNPYKTGDAWLKIMSRDSWSNYPDARQTLNYRYHNQFSNPAGKQWHHIREQSMGGSNNFLNLAVVNKGAHEKISAFYTRTDDQYGQEFKNLRKYLSMKSPAVQWTKGKEVIRDLGYSISTQDKGRGKYQEIT